MRSITKSIPTLLMLVLVMFAQPVPAFAVSGNVRLDSPVYRYLDILNAHGLLRSHLAGTRPITWAEAHRLMEEARERLNAAEGEGGEPTTLARKTLKKLEERIYRRFTGDLRAGTGPLYAAVRDPALILEYLNGDPSPIPDIKASQHALIYNNGGIDPDVDATASFTAEAEAQAGPFHLQIFPRLTTAEEDREPLQRGSFRVGGLAGFELNIARESLWWGQGAHGGLYLTSNAAPLDMLHLSTPHPTVLPWIFRYLGPFRFEFFVSQLEEDRAVPEPYFLGIRSNFRPVYELEMGMTVMVITGGEGRPDVSFGDLFDILFGENELGGEDRSNKIAGFDVRLNLPGYQLYFELGGEDEANNMPSKFAFLVGMYYPEVARNMDLRLEYADFAVNEDNANVWYRHGIYTDGYTYDGRILGHHAGGGARDLFAEVAFNVGEGSRGSLGVDLEQRGIHTQPDIERHAQFMAGWEGDISLGGLNCIVDLTAAVDLVENKDYVRGQTAKDGYLRIEIKGEI